MSPKPSLPSLDARAAFDLAIMIEEDAQVRYEELGQRIGEDPGGAGAVFRAMAVNEQKHRTDLEARRAALFLGDPRIEVSLLDGSVERPAADDEDLPRTARQALEVALDAERRARAFYAEALPGLADEGARALFQALMQEEAEHVDLLERRLAALGPARPGPARPQGQPLAPALAYPERAALAAVLPLFDAATQAVAVGVIVEGQEPGALAAALGVSRRTVVLRLKRFLDLARQHVAVALAAAALTGCAGADLPGEGPRAMQAAEPGVRAAVVGRVLEAQAEQEGSRAAEALRVAEAAAARQAEQAAKAASDLEFSEGLAEPPQGTVVPPTTAWTPPPQQDERPAPVIEDVWPDKLPSTGGQKVVIRGKNLEAAQVLFGLAPAHILEATADHLTVTAPAGAAGDVAVVVTNRDGSFAVSDGRFQFYM